MSRPPDVVAIGLADEQGVVGTGGTKAEWSALGVEPPGGGRSFRRILGRPDATFRRLDHASRALVLAVEAAGLARVLPPEARDETAIVVETERGSLDADLRFARGLDPGPARGAVFVYTLPSSSLGEVALRHGLRGPALCLSIGPDGGGEALREARRLLEDGEARFALACCVEALRDPQPGVPAALRAVAVLLARPDEALPAVGPWPSGPEPFAALAASARGSPS